MILLWLVVDARGEPSDPLCWPISAQLAMPVQGGELKRRVSLFVEERNQCGPDGVPPRLVQPPRDLEGRDLVEWILTDVARATGTPAYRLWSRGDVWLVSPPEGSTVLDTWVRVDAATAPTLEAALQSLSPQLREVMGAYDPMPHWEWEQEYPNRLTQEGPLLEVLRALHAPHERGLVGYFVLPGRAIFPLSPMPAASPGERLLVTHEIPVGWTLWRNPETGQVKATYFPPAGWERADELERTGPQQERFWVEDRGPADLPPPGPGETPPSYPFLPPPPGSPPR